MKKSIVIFVFIVIGCTMLLCSSCKGLNEKSTRIVLDTLKRAREREWKGTKAEKKAWDIRLKSNINLCREALGEGKLNVKD